MLGDGAPPLPLCRPWGEPFRQGTTTQRAVYKSWRQIPRKGSADLRAELRTQVAYTGTGIYGYWSSTGHLLRFFWPVCIHHRSEVLRRTFAASSRPPSREVGSPVTFSWCHLCLFFGRLCIFFNCPEATVSNERPLGRTYAFTFTYTYIIY